MVQCSRGAVFRGWGVVLKEWGVQGVQSSGGGGVALTEWGVQGVRCKRCGD